MVINAALPDGASALTPRDGKPGRYPFIDVLRGLAVVLMIETHTVNALLAPGGADGAFGSVLTFFNGLVAPAFLFCAGLGFAVALWRRSAGGRPGRDLTLTLAKKCLFILLVGYSMHVPVFSLGRLLSAPAGVREGAFQVDILQVIAVSLLGLLGIAVLARTRRGRIICVGTAGMLILLAGALAGGTSVLDGLGGSLPVWLRAYFSPEVSPLFTMVPWAVHLLAGFLAGDLYVRGMTAGEEGRTVGRIALSAAAALVPATAISMVTIREYAGDAFWYWSAEYVVIRLASVVLGMCALWYLTRGGAGPIMSAAGLFGRESLPVYYLHLLIVYGKDFDWSFVRIFPDGMGYPGCFGLAAALTGAMYLFARGWGSAKKNYPRASALAVRGLVAGSVLTFLLS